jgi:hypothetical protein
MLTLEDMLLARGQIDRVCRGTTLVHLWRGNRIDDTRANPLYPDLEDRILPDGDVRVPDVNRYLDPKTNQWMVKAAIEKGTSIVDKQGLFGHKKWRYFFIPKGTFIPPEIIITKDYFIARKGCWHYSISPNYDMTVEKFLKALDDLARNAEVRMGARKNA